MSHWDVVGVRIALRWAFSLVARILLFSPPAQRPLRGLALFRSPLDFVQQEQFTAFNFTSPNFDNSMAQPLPRHRHGRHHRGTGNQRRQGQDTMHTHRQPTLIKTTKDVNQSHASNTQVLSSQEKQELRQALIKIHEQAKAMGSRPKDTQERDGSKDIEADPTDFSKVTSLLR